MSLLDNLEEQAERLAEAAKDQLKDQLIEDYYWNIVLLKPNGVKGVELDDYSDFVDKIRTYAKVKDRPVYTLDCKTLKKHDAIGFLERLSKLPSTPRPIVIIQNITEIPFGDISIYDDPQYVENILVHSWKNETNYLTNKNGEQFVLKSHDYTVFLTWSSKTSDTIKNVWHASDGFAWIGNLNDHKKAFCDSLKSRDYRELKDEYEKLNS